MWYIGLKDLIVQAPFDTQVHPLGWRHTLVARHGPHQLECQSCIPHGLYIASADQIHLHPLSLDSVCSVDCRTLYVNTDAATTNDCIPLHGVRFRTPRLDNTAHTSPDKVSGRIGF